MTNVPQKLRDLWSDLYVLFDRNYLMENSEKSWDSFWSQAMQLQRKYEGCPYMFKALDLVSSMIDARMKAERAPDLHPCTLEDMNLF